MFPFPKTPVKPDINGRWPWTGWRFLDAACAIVSLAASAWYAFAGAIFAAVLFGTSAVLCVASAVFSWTDRLLSHGPSWIAQAALRGALGGASRKR